MTVGEDSVQYRKRKKKKHCFLTGSHFAFLSVNPLKLFSLMLHQMRVTIVHSKIRRNLVLADNDSHQRETIT